jgi:hypothetical protein
LSAALHDWTFRHAISLIRHFSQLVAEGVSTDGRKKRHASWTRRHSTMVILRLLLRLPFQRLPDRQPNKQRQQDAHCRIIISVARQSTISTKYPQHGML